MSRLRSQYEASALYNRWMNERLYTLAESVGEEARTRDLAVKSLRDELFAESTTRRITAVSSRRSSASWATTPASPT